MEANKRPAGPRSQGYSSRSTICPGASWVNIVVGRSGSGSGLASQYRLAAFRTISVTLTMESRRASSIRCQSTSSSSGQGQIGPRAAERHLFDPPALRALAARPAANGEQLWLLINLEIWQRVFHDGESPARVMRDAPFTRMQAA